VGARAIRGEKMAELQKKKTKDAPISKRRNMKCCKNETFVIATIENPVTIDQEIIEICKDHWEKKDPKTDRKYFQTNVIAKKFV
jgi:hypothetical protein